MNARLISLFVVVAWCSAHPCAAVEPPTGNSDSEGTNSLRLQLLQAVSTRDTDRVGALLKADRALADSTNNFGQPVLVLAARQADLQTVNRLLDAGASVDLNDWRHITALSATLEPLITRWRSVTPGPSSADRSTRIAIAAALLERGASIFATREWGGSPISYAMQSRDGELVDFLLTNQRPPTARDNDGYSVVHLAALWGRTNTLKALAGKGVHLELTNNAGLTPLQVTSRLPPDQERFWFRDMPGLDADGPKYKETTARLLVGLGARLDIFSATALGWTNELTELLSQDPESVRSRTGAGETPLHWAAEFGATNTAELLLRAGANIESTNRQGLAPLDVASAKGQNAMAALLVAHRARIHRVKHKGPIHSAAGQGNVYLVKLLLDAGESPDSEDEHGDSAFDFAVRANRDSIVKLLLAAHARIKTGTNRVTVAVHWAAANGNTNLLALLLGHGADVNARNEQGKTPLHLAHERDNFDAIEFLLNHGASIDAADTTGNTVLHTRASAAADRIVFPPDPFRRTPAPPVRSMMEFLLAHGAKVNARNAAGEIPLHRVAWKTFSSSNAVDEARIWIEPLLRYKVNLNARDVNGRTPLLSAVSTYNIPFIEALLKLGVDINASDRSGSTALHLLLKSPPPGWDYPRQPAFLEWLLEHGAKPNMADRTGKTPLHLAVGKVVDYDRELPVLLSLLKYGADVNATDLQGRTPLHIACSADANHPYNASLWRISSSLPGDAETFVVYCVDWRGAEDGHYPGILVTNGARINLRDRAGNTALHYAAQAARTNSVQLLLDHGADRTARNRKGETPLQLAYENPLGNWVIPFLRRPGVGGEIGEAAWANDLKRVQAFLDDDPGNANATWIWGSSPLHWACNEGHVEMVKLLLQSGARVNGPDHVRSDMDRMVEVNQIENYLQTRRGSWTNHVRASEFSENGGAYISMTPLQLALATGHDDIALLLIRRGAKVDLGSAASLGMNGVLRKLIGADPRRVNEFMRRSSWYFQPLAVDFAWNFRRTVQSGTPLHFAVRRGQKSTVELMLAAGADSSVLDDEGRTPLKLALEMGHAQIATLLKRWEEDRALKRR